MTGQKIDYSLTRNGQLEPVKARIFQGFDGKPYASLDGAFFNGWELSREQIVEHVALMVHLLEKMGGPLDGKTTT
jgi:hypothetical protein